MESKIIQRYKKKSTKDLLRIATKHFNKFIRERDSHNHRGQCISSRNWMYVPSSNAHAGHFYSSGKYPRLRFNENNVHLQSKSDNYFGHGNLNDYRINLIEKIGITEVKKLDTIARDRSPFKWDRFFIIGIIEKYK